MAKVGVVVFALFFFPVLRSLVALSAAATGAGIGAFGHRVIFVDTVGTVRRHGAVRFGPAHVVSGGRVVPAHAEENSRAEKQQGNYRYYGLHN